MTTRTWHVANGTFGQPAGWDPWGSPLAGDLLIMSTGTSMAAYGDYTAMTITLTNTYSTDGTGWLPGPVLNMAGDHFGTVNVSVPHDATINVMGGASTIDNLHFASPYPGGTLTVTIAGDSTLTETMSGGYSKALETVNLHALGSEALLINKGPSFMSRAIVDVDVGGNGQWNPGSYLEFGRAVSSGQTVNLDGVFDRLRVDDPGDFQATIHLVNGWGPGIGAAQLLFAGLHADHFTYRNDMLRLTAGGQSVGAFRIREDAGQTFSVKDTADGTVLVGNLGGHGGDTAPQATRGAILPGLTM